jgi:hypothetical protein
MSAAFPRPAVFTATLGLASPEQDGMSLREYFAAHAPAVPDWFEPFAGNEPSIPSKLDRAEAMPQVPGFAALSQDHRNYLMAWATSGGDHWDAPEDVEVFTEAAWKLIEQREAEIREAKQRLAAQRFFRWRWYYADQMLAALDGRTA